MFFIAGGFGKVYISRSAEFWSSPDSSVQDNLTYASYALGRFFATAGSYSIASTNGLVWQRIDTQLRRVVELASRFQTDQKVSSNGIQWTVTGNPSTFISIAAQQSTIFGIVNNALWTSIDGTNWVSRPVPLLADDSLSGVASGGGRVVAVGRKLSNGKGVIIASEQLISGSGANLEIALHPGISVLGSIGRTYTIESAQPPIQRTGRQSER